MLKCLIGLFGPFISTEVNFKETNSTVSVLYYNLDLCPVAYLYY